MTVEDRSTLPHGQQSGRPRLLVVPVALLLAASPVAAQDIIDTYAGTGVGGYTGDGGAATSAEVNNPQGVAIAANGDVYIADKGNFVIRKVDGVTGDISTIAGGGTPQTGDGGPATVAWLNEPQTMAVDSSGNVYIADTKNHRIRKVDWATGDISTIAGTGVPFFGGDGGPATSAQIKGPRGIVFDSVGNLIFADSDNKRIRMITPGGTISTIAGNGGSGYSGDGGPATAASLKKPYAVAVDGADAVYLVDEGAHVVRKFTVGGTIFTAAGTGTSGYSGDGGPAVSAQIKNPRGLWVVGNGVVMSSDTFGNGTAFGNKVKDLQDTQVATQVTLPQNGTVTSISAYLGSSDEANDTRFAIYTDVAGEPDTLIVQTETVRGPDSTADVWVTLNLPPTALTAGTYWLALAFEDKDQEYFFDSEGGETRHRVNDAVNLGYLATWGTSSTSNNRKVSIYASYYTSLTQTNEIYVADTENHRVRKFTDFGTINTIVGTGVFGYTGDGGPAIGAQINKPEGLVLNAAGDIFIGDTNNSVIRKVAAATGNIATYGGTGTVGYSGDGGAATSATMYEPRGVSVNASGDLYLADSGNHLIRKITAATGVITLVAGTPRDNGIGDGLVATSAFVEDPVDVAVDSSGNLYIACSKIGRVRKVDAATSIISTIIGSGFELEPGSPWDDVMILEASSVAVDGAGNVFVADRGKNNSRIVKYDVAATTYATVAGTGTDGYSGDGGPAIWADLWRPRGVDVDSAGNIYIADTDNHRIRKVDAGTGVIDTVAGDGGATYDGDGGLAIFAGVEKPQAVAAGNNGKFYIVSMDANVVRKVDTGGIITTIAGTGIRGYSGDGGDATLAMLDQPRGVGLNASGSNDLFIGDTGNHRVRYIDGIIKKTKIIRWTEVDPYRP